MRTTDWVLIVWVYPGVSYRLDLPGKLPKGGPERCPDQMPTSPQVVPFFNAKEELFYSEPPSDLKAPKTQSSRRRIFQPQSQ